MAMFSNKLQAVNLNSPQKVSFYLDRVVVVYRVRCFTQRRFLRYSWVVMPTQQSQSVLVLLLFVFLFWGMATLSTSLSSSEIFGHVFNIPISVSSFSHRFMIRILKGHWVLCSCSLFLFSFFVLHFFYFRFMIRGVWGFLLTKTKRNKTENVFHCLFYHTMQTHYWHNRCNNVCH